MITNRRSFVVGDETNSLEAPEAQKLEVDRGEALVDFGAIQRSKSDYRDLHQEARELDPNGP